MVKTVSNTLKQDKTPYKVPRKVQDIIPITRIWSDGIFKCGNAFSQCFAFADINYQVASKEAKEQMLISYGEILNSMDSGCTVKITVNTHYLNRADYEKSILLEKRKDGRNAYRDEYNRIMLQKAEGVSGITQERYITVSAHKKNIEEARKFFGRIGDDLKARFSALGSSCDPMDATARLRTLHDFYRPGDETAFEFNMKGMMRRGGDFRDYICPDSVERRKDCIKLGEKYARVLYLKNYASYIKDDFISELTDFNGNMMLSIDFIPVPTDEAVREVERLLLGVETNATNWQRRQNKNNNFSATLPYDIELQRKETKEFLNDITSRDQRMMFALVTMVITADSLQELDTETEAILSIGRKRMCQIAVLKYQQTDGLNTVLPIGTRKINTFRTLTTESLSVLIPFKAQEIQEPGGIYFGENAISHNLIFCNMENLLNQSMFLLGIPGSGKSFFAKLMILCLALSSDADIIICDPEGEYAQLVKALKGTVVKISASGSDHVNAMDMVYGYGDNNPIAAKSEFIMSLIEQIDKDGVTAKHKSIIDRCIESVFIASKMFKTTPTLCTLRDELLKQPEEQAKELALALELYTSGSLDIFAHETNVDMSNRMICFDIHELGSQLKPAGLLTITDAMINRVVSNARKGKKTYLFIDEFHVVFENEHSEEFFTAAWRQFRKRNAYPCAITQNVEYLLSSVSASTMLSNSEMVVMFNQAASDRSRLAKLLNISKDQLSFITNAEAGCGLMKYGSALVPFINRFPTDSKIYKLMTTKPADNIVSKGRA